MPCVPTYKLYYCLAVALIRDREFCSLINHHVSCSGFTALHYAIVIDNREVVECLLESGADPTIENHRGLAPSDYCTNQEILTLLQQHTVMVTIINCKLISTFLEIVIGVSYQHHVILYH